MLTQFLIVQAHEDERVAFLAHQFVYLRIVVSFVFAAEDEHGRRGHGLQRVPAGIDVRRLGVVDIPYAFDGSYILQSVLHALEGLQTLANNFVLDLEHIRCDGGRHRVQYVMTSFECQFIFSERQRVRLRETVRIERCTELQAFHFPVNDRVFSPVDERIVCRLVTRDTKLGVDVVLELEIVPVEVIRRDVQ